MHILFIKSLLTDNSSIKLLLIVWFVIDDNEILSDEHCLL